MSWAKAFLVVYLVFLTGVLANQLFGKSTEEKAISKKEQCHVQCDFEGATTYSINLGDERDCICTFRNERRK